MIGLIISSLSFLLGNFVYQFFTSEPNYLVAFERAYFQAVSMIFIIIWYKNFTIKSKGAG